MSNKTEDAMLNMLKSRIWDKIRYKIEFKTLYRMKFDRVSIRIKFQLRYNDMKDKNRYGHVQEII